MQRSSAVDIRSATLEDVPTILRLIRQLAEYEHLAHEVVATAESLRHALFGERPSAEALLAHSAGQAVGFALYFHNFSTFLGVHGLYLEDLFVLPECRGQGIGKALLVHLAQVAVARGCGRFEWSVLDWNRPARDFYESLGARAMSSWIVHRVSGEALADLAAKGTLHAP